MNSIKNLLVDQSSINMLEMDVPILKPENAEIFSKLKKKLILKGSYQSSNFIQRLLFCILIIEELNICVDDKLGSTVAESFKGCNKLTNLSINGSCKVPRL